MKNLTTLGITTLFMICYSYILQAQDNIVKVGLIGLAYKNINLKYERAVNEKSSLNLNIQYRIPGACPLVLLLKILHPK